MKDNDKRIRDIIHNYASIKKIFEPYIHNNLQINKKNNKLSRNYSYEKENELNKTNISHCTSPYLNKSFFVSDKNVLHGRCNSKEKPKISFCHCVQKSKINLKLGKIKSLNLKTKLRKKNNILTEKNFEDEYDSSMNLNLSFNSNFISKKNFIDNKHLNNNKSTEYIITHLNYQIISVKTKDTNDSLKNDIIILMKQLKEKEEQVSTMNDHIKLLNDELKRIKTQNIKLYNYIQTLEKEGKKINNTLFNNTSSFSDENNSTYGTNLNNNLNNNIPFNIPTNLQISHQFSISLNIYKPKYLQSIKMYSPKKIILNQNLKNKGDFDNYLIFKPFDNTRFLKFDFINNNFQLISFADYSNYTINFNKESYSYLNLNGSVFIITGKNNDMFYFFNYKKRCINRLSNLKYNHQNCSLIKYDNKLICLSGNFTKKVESYDLKSNKWDDSIIKEMNQERSKSCYLLINNYLIYAFYGYNYIKSKFINNIEFYDIKSNLWKEISINNNINGIIEHTCYIDYNNDIIILGGITENGFNKNYYKLNLRNQKLINVGYEKVNNENLLFNTHVIMVRNDYDYENYLICFDKNNNVHRFSPNEIVDQIIIYN